MLFRSEQKIERLERQINSLRRKEIFDRVEVPKAKYGIPRNEGMNLKQILRGQKKLLKKFLTDLLLKLQ